MKFQMSDLVTSETVTEEVQPEIQVIFLKPRDVFSKIDCLLDCQFMVKYRQ